MKKLLILFLILGFFSLMAGIFLPYTLPSGEEILFSVKKGEGSRDIALNLEKDGFISWGPLFRLYVLVSGISGQLQAGDYFLSPGTNIPQIAEKFASGETARRTVTIPEGFTVEQIRERLGVEIDPDLEGYLFPDTYHFPYNASSEVIVQMMQDNFQKKTEGLGATEDIVIMASLLEKELQTKEDKEIASGILWKRLEIGMPLQVDAEMWTYENRGLPPKPICNPGLESIAAALNPVDSSYWYYLSTPEGKTIFSQTLEEHNIAKAKYLH